MARITIKINAYDNERQTYQLDSHEFIAEPGYIPAQSVENEFSFEIPNDQFDNDFASAIVNSASDQIDKAVKLYRENLIEARQQMKNAPVKSPNPMKVLDEELPF